MAARFLQSRLRSSDGKALCRSLPLVTSSASPRRRHLPLSPRAISEVSSAPPLYPSPPLSSRVRVRLLYFGVCRMLDKNVLVLAEC